MVRSIAFSRLVWCLALASSVASEAAILIQPDGFHVFPGDSIQEAMELAARNPTNRAVKVHAGTYRPKAKRQALVWFNRKHDGIHLEAIGSVILTAENAELTNPRAPGYPAVVNHVVYFGDGVSSNTILSGFRITGANHFVTEKRTEEMEPDTAIAKNLFFYTDGGAIKVFGRSYPTIRRVTVVGNYASPCAGGISVQHEGYDQSAVTIEDSVFMRNRAQVTGAAVDLLRGSAAVIRNCLFVGNQSNTGEDVVAKKSGEAPFDNSGVLTIFDASRALVQNCTFTGNRNAVDDLGGGSVYDRCVFSGNTLAGAWPQTERYELELPRGGRLRRCMVAGRLRPAGAPVRIEQSFTEVAPLQFADDFRLIGAAYEGLGYQPVGDLDLPPSGP